MLDSIRSRAIRSASQCSLALPFLIATSVNAGPYIDAGHSAGTMTGWATAVDDLGAGYSSLSVLAELQPQYIKVDMSIVRNIDREARKRRLMEMLYRFSDATGSSLVAEGVETEDEEATVRACGAPLMQGYLFGRPQLELAPHLVSAPYA